MSEDPHWDGKFDLGILIEIVIFIVVSVLSCLIVFNWEVLK